MELNGTYLLLAALVLLGLIVVIAMWGLGKRSKEGESAFSDEDVFEG